MAMNAASTILVSLASLASHSSYPFPYAIVRSIAGCGLVILYIVITSLDLHSAITFNFADDLNPRPLVKAFCAITALSFVYSVISEVLEVFFTFKLKRTGDATWKKASFYLLLVNVLLAFFFLLPNAVCSSFLLIGELMSKDSTFTYRSWDFASFSIQIIAAFTAIVAVLCKTVYLLIAKVGGVAACLVAVLLVLISTLCWFHTVSTVVVLFEASRQYYITEDHRTLTAQGAPLLMVVSIPFVPFSHIPTVFPLAVLVYHLVEPHAALPPIGDYIKLKYLPFAVALMFILCAPAALYNYYAYDLAAKSLHPRGWRNTLVAINVIVHLPALLLLVCGVLLSFFLPFALCCAFCCGRKLLEKVNGKQAALLVAFFIMAVIVGAAAIPVSNVMRNYVEPDAN